MLSLFNICINPVNSKQEKKKIVYYDEIFSRNICKNKKCPYLCSRNRETYYSKLQKIVLWCNGNTSDSGPEIPGSSPGRTTT